MFNKKRSNAEEVEKGKDNAAEVIDKYIILYGVKDEKGL